MVSFDNFVKSMPPSLSEAKVTPSFCFPFKIPDNPTATNIYFQMKRLQYLQETTFAVEMGCGILKWTKRLLKTHLNAK